jgi:tetratricopeptide (TPR) repeat protein
MERRGNKLQTKAKKTEAVSQLRAKEVGLGAGLGATNPSLASGKPTSSSMSSIHERVHTSLTVTADTNEKLDTNTGGTGVNTHEKGDAGGDIEDANKSMISKPTNITSAKEEFQAILEGKYIKSKSSENLKSVPSLKSTQSTRALQMVGEQDDDEDNESDEVDNDVDDEGEIGDKDGGYREHDEELISNLRRQARRCIIDGDYIRAEAVLDTVLELDPLDVATLNIYAEFLHKKKGELARAEAFYSRALQVCLPRLVTKIQELEKSGRQDVDLEDLLKTHAESPLGGHAEHVRMAPTSPPRHQASPRGGAPPMRLPIVMKLLKSFARFLSRAKGDVGAAAAVYRQAAAIMPSDAATLASLAHFLAEEGGDKQEAFELFARALKIDPSNVRHALWYAKLLKRNGKVAQADLMYRVAVQRSSVAVKNSTFSKLHPSACCNYATFLYRQRKNIDTARQLFQDSLQAYPTHKGLNKNFNQFKKAHPPTPTTSAATEKVHGLSDRKTSAGSVDGYTNDAVVEVE